MSRFTSRHHLASALRGALLLVALVAVAPGPASAQRRVAAPEDVSPEDELVQLDFNDVELAVVIDTIARLTGTNFIYDDRVRGRVTIISPAPIPKEQAFAVFESVLKVKGFTAIGGPGGVMKIIPIRDAKESSIETVGDSRPPENRDRYLTRLIPLRYISAEDITNTIKPLVSKDASMVAYGPTNTIIITDSDSNVKRLLEILEAIDVETYKEELVVLKVEYADAATLAEQVAEIYEVESAGPATARRARRTAARRNRAGAASTTPASVEAAARGRVRIITDERTNSLIVLSPRSEMDDIRELVHTLDVPVPGQGRIRVYYLRHADSEELAQTLNSLLSGQPRTTGGAGAGRAGAVGAGGAQAQALRSTITELAEGLTITADPATNSLVIQASREAYSTLAEVIGLLDIARPQVLVEALLVEVDVTDNVALGVQETLRIINGDSQYLFTTAASAVTPGGAPAVANFVRQTFTSDSDGNATSNGTLVNAVIRAAAQDNKLDVIASPHILTSDNEEAEIRIGNNIPIITSRVDAAAGAPTLSSSVNVERQDIGVTLRVTPQISEGDSLRLQIFQELTDVNQSLTDTVAGGSAEGAVDVGVALTNRRVENTVVVADGETVVIGGLIQERYEDIIGKVPFLGDIPILGWLFRATEKSLQKVNLLVFLTPHIVRNPEDLEQETIRKREEFQEASGHTYDFGQYSEPPERMTARKLAEHENRYPVQRMEEIERAEEAARALRAALEASGTEGRRYAISAGRYENEREATQVLTRLLDAGFDGSLATGRIDGKLIYDIKIGPYDDLIDAERDATVLEDGYDMDPRVELEAVPE